MSPRNGGRQQSFLTREAAAPEADDAAPASPEPPSPGAIQEEPIHYPGAGPRSEEDQDVRARSRNSSIAGLTPGQQGDDDGDRDSEPQSRNQGARSASRPRTTGTGRRLRRRTSNSADLRRSDIVGRWSDSAGKSCTVPAAARRPWTAFFRSACRPAGPRSGEQDQDRDMEHVDEVGDDQGQPALGRSMPTPWPTTTRMIAAQRAWSIDVWRTPCWAGARTMSALKRSVLY